MCFSTFCQFSLFWNTPPAIAIRASILFTMSAVLGAEPSRISDKWRGMSNVFKHERDHVREFINTLNFDWLENRANNVLGRTGCEVRRDIFSSGQDNIVFELSFPDNTMWVARISKPPFANVGASSTPSSHRGAAEMLSEIYTIDYVSKNTTIPTPRILDYDVNRSNPLGAPYMLMEEIQGHFVEHLTRIPKLYIRHVYHQIAEIVLQLSHLQFPLLGLLQHSDSDSKFHVKGAIVEGYKRFDAFSSAKAFYTTRALHFLYQKQVEIPADPDWIALAWLYLEAIPLFCSPELDSGPFPLKHPDLNNGNILYDSQYNIVGVLDWTATQTAPWQSFVVPPNQFEAPEDLPLRNLYFEVFEEVEKLENPLTPLSNMMKHSNCVMTELVDCYYGWTRCPLGYAKRLARLVYGDAIEWSDVKAMYEEMMKKDETQKT
jgi:isoamyl acetate esterase